MKKLFIVAILFCQAMVFGINQQQDLPNIEHLIPIDKVVVIVDGPERRYLICQSELNRVGIDGRKPALDDLIIEELIYQDALKHKIPIDDYADRYIRSIKKNHNIGDKEVTAIFESAGLSSEEGRLKLQKMGANTTMIDVKVKARIVIAMSDVEKEFEKNPLYEPAQYELQVAFIPFYSREKNKQEEQYSFLINQIEKNELDIPWGPLFWINESDLAEDKFFITRMKTGTLSKPQLVNNGFEIYCLKNKKDKRLVTLEERYRDIVDYLREPKYKEMFDDYVNELYKTASIIPIS